MGLRRKTRKPEKTGGHYMVMSKTLDAWICITEHEVNCGEIRDRHGRPLTLQQATERLEASG